VDTESKILVSSSATSDEKSLPHCIKTVSNWVFSLLVDLEEAATPRIPDLVAVTLLNEFKSAIALAPSGEPCVHLLVSLSGLLVRPVRLTIPLWQIMIWPPRAVEDVGEHRAFALPVLDSMAKQIAMTENSDLKRIPYIRLVG